MNNSRKTISHFVLAILYFMLPLTAATKLILLVNPGVSSKTVNLVNVALFLILASLLLTKKVELKPAGN